MHQHDIILGYISVSLAVVYQFCTIALFVLALYLLSVSKAKVSDPGHLNTNILWTILAFYAIFCVTVTIRLMNTSYNDFTMKVEMVYWSLVMLSMYIDAYIVMTFELTDFKLCSQINADNTVSIIGISINGNEIFKFKIDEA